MMFKRPKSALSNQRGFTFIELLMVIAILGVLSAIALQQLKNNREKSFDRQAQAMIRNLLTYAAVDTPDPPAGQENQNGNGGSLAIYGYPEIEIPGNVYWTVINDAKDRWRFFFAHPGGGTGYYFWVPGAAYSFGLDDDEAPPPAGPNRSDKLVAHFDFRAAAGVP
jgi:prepilin-type N-terminal cleavage/methylation domain-containing protein